MASSEQHHFEWDETKRQHNINIHGIDFVRAITVWENDVLEFESSQTHHDEERFLAIGIIGPDERIITVIYTWRVFEHERVKRIISARRARKYEQENYQNAFGRGT